jgi:hypothetical protein
MGEMASAFLAAKDVNSGLVVEAVLSKARDHIFKAGRDRDYEKGASIPSAPWRPVQVTLWCKRRG